LKQLDFADYFCALQLYDGTVEIFGFEFGMTTAGYTYDAQNSGGGAIIKLISLQDALEDELPFSDEGGANDFDNLFADVIFVPHGDFNDDFNAASVLDNMYIDDNVNYDAYCAVNNNNVFNTKGYKKNV